MIYEKENNVSRDGDRGINILGHHWEMIILLLGCIMCSDIWQNRDIRESEQITGC
jgi:hypothetical protein